MEAVVAEHGARIKALEISNQSVLLKLDTISGQLAAVLARLETGHTPETCSSNRELHHLYEVMRRDVDDLYGKFNAMALQIATANGGASVGLKVMAWVFGIVAAILAGVSVYALTH